MRERGIVWSEIEYGRRHDYAGLQDFLEEQADINFWPNMSITDLEVKALMEKLDSCDMPYTCPHGRPTIIKFTKYELEKWFKRLV